MKKQKQDNQINEDVVNAHIQQSRARVINVVPGNVRVNGFTIGYTFKDFREWCIKHGYNKESFVNYPFSEGI